MPYALCLVKSAIRNPKSAMILLHALCLVKSAIRNPQSAMILLHALCPLGLEPHIDKFGKVPDYYWKNEAANEPSKSDLKPQQGNFEHYDPVYPD